MSTVFLTTTVDDPDLQLAVEVAWGADLTDLDGSSWTWDDITDHVILERGGGAGGGSGKGGGLGGDARGGGVSITLGRPDFSQETQTAEMQCQLDNRSGDYSQGGMGPHWPYVRQGTPVRVRVTTDGGSTWHVRFQGSANGFTPQWDAPTGRWATVTLSASGPLRKLNQGTLPAKSVYATEIPRSTGWSGMFLYWPCESGDGVKNNPSLVPASGHPALKLDTAYTPKVANNPSNTAFPLSGPLQSSFKMAAGQAYAGGEAIPSYTDTGVLQVRQMVAIPGAFPVAQWQPLFFMKTTNATVPTWQLQINENGSLRLIGQDSGGGVVRTGTAIGFTMNGVARLVAITFDNNGSGLDTEIRTMDHLGVELSWDESFASTNIGTLTGLNPVGPDFSEGGLGTENALVGHVTVQNASTFDLNAAAENVFLGMPGETPQARLTRLCNNHNIYLDTLDSVVASSVSITDTMGPQYYDTLTTLIRECELTGQGALYDGLGPGLTYITKEYRQTSAAAPAMVLDAEAAQLMEPFAPVDDDQLLINHADASVRNGATATWLDEDGPAGTDAVGDYATSLSVNPQDDGNLVYYAQWMVGLGTQEGYRYPSVSFALETNPILIDDWLACTPQSRVDVENIDAIRRQHPTETIKLMLEGWHEEIDAFTWRVTANTSDANPWNVVRLAAATGSTGDDICHLQTESSQLNADYTSGTTISVRTNTGLRWITTSEDADSFPFDISIGGIKATVTGVTSTTSPQTFTLSAALPRAFTGSTTPGAGAPVEVWRPPVYGL